VWERPILTTADTLRMERLTTIRDTIRAAVQGAQATTGRVLVAVEAEVYGMRGTQSTDQAAVQAVVQMMLWELPMRPRFLHVNVAHVKKFAGAPKKEHILMQVYKKWDREYQDNNLADAFIVAQVGLAFLAHREAQAPYPYMTKPQVEVLAKMDETGWPWEQGSGVGKKPRKKPLRPRLRRPWRL
jgi:hypothetical protein